MKDLLKAINFGDITVADLTIIFEAAHVALSDADTYEDIADQMDLNDDELKKVQDKLHAIMEYD